MVLSMVLVVLLVVLGAACATLQDEHALVRYPSMSRWEGFALILGAGGEAYVGEASLVDRPVLIVTMPTACAGALPARPQEPRSEPRYRQCYLIDLDPAGDSPNVYIASRTIIDMYPQLRGLTEYTMFVVAPSKEACAERRAQDSTRPERRSAEDMRCRPATLTIR